MRKAVWIAAIVAVVMACGYGLKAGAAAPADTAQVGATAPNFTLPSQEDKPISLSDFRGSGLFFIFIRRIRPRVARSRRTTSSVTW